MKFPGRCMVELRWLPAPSADSYLLEVAVPENFKDPTVRQTVTGTVAKLVLPPGLYWWRVTGKDPLARRRDRWPGWTPYPERYRDPKHYKRMY